MVTQDASRDRESGIRGVEEVRVAYAVRDAQRVWVFLDGRTYVVEGADDRERERVHVTDDQVALSAPMPATVLAIAVTPGQEVAAGDLLVMLEAMKMELPIRAPRGGRIKALACREGELVQPGVPLIEIE
jgi:3-methylcrotonyl-CoA carboxylase alpha subunit